MVFADLSAVTLIADFICINFGRPLGSSSRKVRRTYGTNCLIFVTGQPLDTLNPERHPYVIKMG